MFLFATVKLLIISYTLLADILVHSVHFQDYNDIHELVMDHVHNYDSK